MKYLENIDEMKSYDWCGAAKQHLTRSIARNINQIDRVCGCVIILLYWICEHAKIIKPNDKNPIPRFARWNITHLAEQLAKSSLHVTSCNWQRFARWNITSYILLYLYFDDFGSYFPPMNITMLRCYNVKVMCQSYGQCFLVTISNLLQ
ncbi:hypothetical protein ACSBR2_012552 [Camellia fascicularis]